MRTTYGETSEYPVSISLHQGSALSPYLFALIMDEVTAHIQKEAPWFMLFANDKVLVNESRDGATTKLKRWREALESKGFKMSRTEIEYMVCNFRRQYKEMKLL